jgi:hypothetical protein
MLEASISTDAAAEPGTICLDINHTNNVKTQEEQKRHRLFSDVPAADVRPPNNIHSVSLQSVRLSMDILETNLRRKPIRKRPSISPGERQNTSLDAETSDTLLYNLGSVDDVTRDRALNHTVDGPLIQKRKRPATETAPTNQNASQETVGRSKRPRLRRVTDSFVASSPLPDLASPEQLKVGYLVNGALRLSFCGDLNKMPNGLKVKASTFRFGLLDVAPVLWKPGYLTVRNCASSWSRYLTSYQTLSQRAHLIPTIARSLCQVGSIRASSVSLKNKISSLSAAPHQGRFEVSRDNESGSGQGKSPVGSSVTSQLWVLMQKRLSHSSTAPLQTFVVSGAHGAHSDSVDMLVEVGCSDDGRVLHPTCSAFPATLEGDQLRGPDPRGSNSRTNVEQLEDDLLVGIDSQDLIAFHARKHSHASTATARRQHETQHVEHNTDHVENFSSNFRHLPMFPKHELLHEEDVMFGEYGVDDENSTDLILPI